MYIALGLNELDNMVTRKAENVFCHVYANAAKIIKEVRLHFPWINRIV